MNAKETQCSDDIQQTLHNLVQEAKMERLECAVTLIKVLQDALNIPTGKATPVGFLTVQSWLALLNRWELILQKTPQRHVYFSGQFLNDVITRGHLQAPPVGGLLAGLAALVERFAQSMNTKVAA